MPRSRGLNTRIRGIGRLYVAYEPITEEPRTFSIGWIIEMSPPYRVGHGVRLRVRGRAFQVGVCRKHLDSNPLRQVGGRPLLNTSEQIGSWWNGVPSDQAEAQEPE